ncbi:MAG: DUF2336 domain-containing protein, partial [Rhodospirillales bacterium]|nr:DUF2336 domain-containing protein [Rhodospirillales bacterium]
GEVNTFVTLFGRMTELKPHMIDRIMFDPAGKGLAISCKSLGAGKIAFVSLFTLAQKIRAEDTGTIKVRLRDAIDFYDALPQKDAVDVMNEWRRGTDYVGSIRVMAHRMKSLQH